MKLLLEKYFDYLEDLQFGLWKVLVIVVGAPLVVLLDFLKICFMLVFFIFFIDEIFRSGPARLPKR